MKILLVTEPGVNGVFRYVEALADFLIEQEVEVHLAYSDRRGSDQLGALIDRIERNGGRTVNLRVGNRPEPGDLRALRSLRALAAAVKPDVIHSHSSKAGALARVLPFLGITGARYVHHAHAYVGMRPQRGRIDFVYDCIERVLAKWSTTICCSGDEFNYARGMLRIAEHRLARLPNGVDCAHFAPPVPERRAALRKKFGLPANGLVLGSLGRTSEQKDPLTMYRAFARAAKLRPDLTLFHVGTGELDGELEKFIAAQQLTGRVVRLNYLSTPVDFYQAVDGFMQTSRYEGLSLALLEAMACDLPLILSEAPGNGDVLALPLSQMWSAPAADDGAFFGAIAQWAQDRARPQPPSINHREITKERFERERCLRRVTGLYEDLLSTGKDTVAVQAGNAS